MAENITVTMSGPLFDGRAPRIISDYLDAAKWVVARQGHVDIGLELRRVIRQPTPYYWTRVTIDRARTDLVVNDQGVVYGPWLEGVGSRNFPVTSFRGYQHWRRTRDKLRGKADGIAENVLQRYLPKLNGEA